MVTLGADPATDASAIKDMIATDPCGTRVPRGGMGGGAVVQEVREDAAGDA
jgi:hypothetical protein